MYLCAQRVVDAGMVGTAPITALAAVVGNHSACPSGSSAVPAAKGMPPGEWDFDPKACPKGEHVRLCAFR